MLKKSDEQWRKDLTTEQYHVLREKGTEAPFSGELLEMSDNGQYHCAACGALLFNSNTKYDNNSGWPSFNEAIPGSVIFSEDNSHGMHRTEVTCANCGSHLGHIFDDSSQPTGKDYCINSVALDFKPKERDGS